MLISLRKYLENRPEQVTDALLRAILLLLEAIDCHAISGDSAGYARFRQDIASVRERLAGTPPAYEILVLAGKTAKSLEEYNDRTGKLVGQQRAELQAMVAMLTNAMGAVAAGSQTAIARLLEIEDELQGTTQLEDLQTARIRMSECLHGLHAEIGRQKLESTQQLTRLKVAIARSKDAAAFGTSLESRADPITGLPERPAAEAALADAVKTGNPVYAVLFVVERLDLINSRFGREVGDQVLSFLREHIAQSLSKPVRLFRWTGPALIAIVERDVAAPALSNELSRILPRKLSKTVMVANRSVLLALPSNWMVFAAHEVHPFQQLLRDIDSFVQANSCPTSAPAAL
jgi:GGDEF domain-containing protein